MKKFLAALTTIALSLGLVALTATPASAHHNTITGVVSCNTTPDGFWKVTWTVENSENRSETITYSSNEQVVPTGTQIGPRGEPTFVQYFSVKPNANVSLTLTGDWANGQTDTRTGTVDRRQFSDNCIPDDTSKKVPICHWTPGQGGKWTSNEVSISAVLNGTGHGGDVNDIIPPFTYVKQGVPGSYGGQNWNGNAYNQWLHGQDCDNTVTPKKPTSTNAVCVAHGQSTGSVTIPSGVVGFSYAYRYGTSGGWTDVAQGTVLSGIAQGSIVQVRVTVLPGYSASWGGGWTSGSGNERVLQLSIGGTQASKCVTPAVATLQHAVCNSAGTGVTGGYYYVTSTANVTYQISTNGGSFVTITSSNRDRNVSVPEGTLITIRAVAAGGYTLVGYTGPWTLNFTSPGDCLDDVTPAAATFTDSICEPNTTGKTQGGYLIPTTANVTYTVSLNGGAAVPATTGTFVNTNPLDEVQITAVAAAGYTLVGTSSWSHTFANPGDCLDDVTPATAVFTDSICEPNTTGKTQGGYLIPTTANVSYTVSLNGAPAVPATTGTFVNTNTLDEVLITATAAAGYKLVGTSSWSHTFANPGDCLDEVPIGVVAKVDQECVVIEDLQTAGKFASVLSLATGSYIAGWITIPSTPNVDYFIAPDLDTPVAAGDHERAPGTYYVHAVAKPGYSLTGYDGPIELKIEPAFPCGDLTVLPVVTPVVTFVQTTCVANGSYTLGVLETGNEAGVTWTVSGGLPTTVGKHNVTTPGKVTITATPAAGYGFPEVEGSAPPVLTWEYTFQAFDGDCLPTLALTGATGSLVTGALGLAALLTLGGVLLVARSRERVSAE